MSGNVNSVEGAAGDSNGKAAAGNMADDTAESSVKSNVRSGGEHRKTRRLDWHSVVETLAFLVGLAIFLYPLVASYLNYSEQQSALDEYEAVVARLPANVREQMWQQAKTYDEQLGRPALRDPFNPKTLSSPLDRYWKTLDVDGHGMMAYVDIPKISVKLPIYHGTGDGVLMKGAGHIATTHLPTDNSTVHSVITGHTGLVGHVFFDNLTQMKMGDVFRIRVLDHNLSYKVDSITVILPEDVQSLQPIEGRNYVTLITCTPYGINDHRLLVRGHFIGEDRPMTKPQGLPLWSMWLFLIAVLLCVLTQKWLRVKRTRLLRGTTSHRGAGMATEPESAESADRLKRRVQARCRWLTVAIWALGVLAVFCAWASVGLMMRTGFLPAFDLGYSWFDGHVLPWFGVTALQPLSTLMGF